MESTDILLDLPDPSSIDLAGPSDTNTEADSDSKSPPLDSGIAGTNRSDMTAEEPETDLTLASVAPIMEEVGSGRATPVSASAIEEPGTGNAASASAHEEQVTENSGPEPATLASTSQVGFECATPASATVKGEEDEGPESATPAITSPDEEQETEDVCPERASPDSATPDEVPVTEEVGSEPATPVRASAEEERDFAIGVVDIDSGDPPGAQDVDCAGPGTEEQYTVPYVEPAPRDVGFDNAGHSDTRDDEVIYPPSSEELPSKDDLVHSFVTELAGPSDTSTAAQPDSKSTQLNIGSASTNPPELSADEPETKLILPSVEPEMEDVGYADYADYEEYAGFTSGELHIIPVVEPVMGVVAFNIAGPSHTNDGEEILPPRGDLPSEDVRSHQVRPSSTELSGPSSIIGQEDLSRLPISEQMGTTPDVRTRSGRFSSRFSFVPSSIELAGLLVILPNVELVDAGTAGTELAHPVATEHAGPLNTPAEGHLILTSVELALEIVGSNPASLGTTSAEDEPGSDSGDPSPGQSFHTAGASSIDERLSPSVEPKKKEISFYDAGPSGTKNEEEIVEDLPSDQVRTHEEIADTADPVAPEHADPSSTPAEEHVILATVELALEIVGSNPSSAENKPGSDGGDPSRVETFNTAGASSIEEHLFPSVEPKIKNIAIDDAGPSGTKDEEEIVEDPPSAQVHPSSPDLAGPSSPKGKRKLPPLRILKSRDIREDISSVGAPHCRNFCCSDDDEDGGNRSSLDDLVELGCNCKGNLGRMCVKCLMKWFSPRILVEGKPECEICKAPLPESVRELILSKYADPAGGGLELIDAVGQILELEHNRRVRRMNEGTNFNFAWLISVTQGPQAPAPPTPALPAPEPPAREPLPVSTPDVPLPPPEPQPPQPRRSVWRKLSKFLKCGAPPQ